MFHPPMQAKVFQGIKLISTEYFIKQLMHIMQGYFEASLTCPDSFVDITLCLLISY